MSMCMSDKKGGRNGGSRYGYGRRSGRQAVSKDVFPLATRLNLSEEMNWQQY